VPENSETRTPMLRWQRWLPPIIVVVVILAALLLLGGENPGSLFNYRLF
jgi:hypothetical protein